MIYLLLKTHYTINNPLLAYITYDERKQESRSYYFKMKIASNFDKINFVDMFNVDQASFTRFNLSLDLCIGLLDL